uniref:Uncharacterized protein n=1 Tax=Rhizophora mucronata TaxID=61149 RepID=A0A2P2R0X7_RHIMU
MQFSSNIWILFTMGLIHIEFVFKNDKTSCLTPQIQLR